jgi:hypothetical protein
VIKEPSGLPLVDCIAWHHEWLEEAGVRSVDRELARKRFSKARPRAIQCEICTPDAVVSKNSLNALFCVLLTGRIKRRASSKFRSNRRNTAICCSSCQAK